MKNKILIICTVLVWVISVVISFQFGKLYMWMSTTELEMSKDYNSIFVEEGEVADYTVFENPIGKYSALSQIDLYERKTIVLYMQANNLKLTAGEHKFNRTEGGTLDKYLREEFHFEKID